MLDLLKRKFLNQTEVRLKVPDGINGRHHAMLARKTGNNVGEQAAALAIERKRSENCVWSVMDMLHEANKGKYFSTVSAVGKLPTFG